MFPRQHYMPKIHYFQRYSSKENTATNNTLQLLGRIYSYSPLKASQFLTDPTGESIEIGIEINQQVRGGRAVPDGQVIQRSFKVLIEAKVDTPPDKELNWEGIEVGNRFFCGKPVETNYVKSSSGGIQGARFVNLRDVFGSDFDKLDIEGIAQVLRGKQWE